MKALVLAFLLIASPVLAQDKPVLAVPDDISYVTAIANPISAAIAAYRVPSGEKVCAFGRLAITELVGNGATIGIKHWVVSPRPCLGCAPDGEPSGHTMNSVLGSSSAQWWNLGGWQRWALSAGMVALTGFLRHDANRHTWFQIVSGALVGAGAEAAGHLLRCES